MRAARLLLLVAALASRSGAEEFDPARIALGQKIYAGTCASCHGAHLEGQADWRSRTANGKVPAPPHDASGHTWHHSDNDLFNLTKLGVAAVVGQGYASDMPGFGGQLSDDEIRAVLDYIKSTWPARIRAVQARITETETN